MKVSSTSYKYLKIERTAFRNELAVYFLLELFLYMCICNFNFEENGDENITIEPLVLLLRDILSRCFVEN